MELPDLGGERRVVASQLKQHFNELVATHIDDVSVAAHDNTLACTIGFRFVHNTSY